MLYFALGKKKQWQSLFLSSFFILGKIHSHCLPVGSEPTTDDPNGFSVNARLTTRPRLHISFGISIEMLTWRINISMSFFSAAVTLRRYSKTEIFPHTKNRPTRLKKFSLKKKIKHSYNWGINISMSPFIVAVARTQNISTIKEIVQRGSRSFYYKNWLK